MSHEEFPISGSSDPTLLVNRNLEGVVASDDGAMMAAVEETATGQWRLVVWSPSSEDKHGTIAAVLSRKPQRMPFFTSTDTGELLLRGDFGVDCAELVHRRSFLSPDNQHVLTMEGAEEKFFTAAQPAEWFGQASLDQTELEERYFHHDVVWSPDSRLCVCREWLLSRHPSHGDNCLTVLDAEHKAWRGLVPATGGETVTPLGLRDGIPRFQRRGADGSTSFWEIVVPPFDNDWAEIEFHTPPHLSEIDQTAAPPRSANGLTAAPIRVHVTNGCMRLH